MIWTKTTVIEDRSDRPKRTHSGAGRTGAIVSGLLEGLEGGPGSTTTVTEKRESLAMGFDRDGIMRWWRLSD
jgi:hypothetical protein